MLTELSTW